MESGNIENLVSNFHNKEKYGIYIRNLNEALNLELILKKVQRVIKFNKEALL